MRVQRFAQSELSLGIQPVIFVKSEEHIIKQKLEKPPSLWIPEKRNVIIEYFEPNRQLSYLLPTIADPIGLKEIFDKYDCNFVHAHNAACAYFSYKAGLPTLFDDWEYQYEFFNYQPRTSVIRTRSVGTALLSYARRIRIKKIVLELIRNLPVIVTNDEVERRYRELGATSIWWIPNVPLSFERKYAFAVDVKKKERVTTCYVGAMSKDEKTILRNTSGIRSLWNENKIGDLLVLEGKNHVPHLEVMRRLRQCHLNLLYWQPLSIHRYFLQNKAFLASVVGVPTIISSTLKATIRLLGEYALPINSLNEIPKTIKTHDFAKKYHFSPAHIWEYYMPRIKDAYKAVLKEEQ